MLGFWNSVNSKGEARAFLRHKVHVSALQHNGTLWATASTHLLSAEAVL